MPDKGMPDAGLMTIFDFKSYKKKKKVIRSLRLRTTFFFLYSSFLNLEKFLSPIGSEYVRQQQ